MQDISATPKNQQKVTITKQEADKLHEKAKKFQQQLEKEKAKFSSSENEIYFIVSSKFLKQWRDYAMAHSLQRCVPFPMNSDIYINQELKPDLKQGLDFQFLSEDLFKTFSKCSGYAIKRRAVTIGTQKRVPIYLNQYKYMIITHEDLRAIDRGNSSAGNLHMKKAKVYELQTLQIFLNVVRQDQKLPLSKSLRFWKIGKFTVQQIYKHIKKETYPIRSYEYKIQFPGKKVQEKQAKQTKMGDFQLQQEQFFVVECKDQMKKWHLFSDSEGKCQGCYSIAELKFPCGCKKVAYCTQQCQQKDKRFHLRHCDYAQLQQLNKKIQMSLTANSSRGVVGLSNLGNTCFMNSCLQCLSNTFPLTEYFINGYFENQINKTNPIGTKGKLAKTYAKFIKSMWCDSNSTFSPYNIKNAVSSINPMFSGYAQHDSQEFFSFLVDGLHEDLNRIQKKPYVQSVDSNGRPDKVVALDSWIAHTKRNQSVIVDLMTGQYKSKVTCPECGVESITFDPFITVTLPIPQKVQHTLGFFLIHADMYKKTERYYLKYESAKAQIFYKNASQVTKLKEGTFGLYVVSVTQGIYKVGRQSLSEIIHKIQSQSKNMFLIQYTEEDMKILNPVQLTVRFAKKTSYDLDNLWFKFPFFFSKDNLTGLSVTKKALKFLYGQSYTNNTEVNEDKKNEAFETYLKTSFEARPFKLFLKYNKKLERVYQKLEYKFQDQVQITDETQIMPLLEKYGSSDCQIDVRFSRKQLEKFDFQRLKDFDDTMKKPKTQASQDVTVNLNQCFQNFRQIQKLQAGNEWFCPKCKQHKQANKQLSIFKASKILILHLKRFKQKGMLRKQKNESKVIFPMELNMKDHLIDPTPISSYVDQMKKCDTYIEPKVQKPAKCSQQPLYDLFAVSNHYGGLGGGHYTAYAKNNGKWYDFNDSSVRQCSATSVCGSGAYILFYQRRD